MASRVLFELLLFLTPTLLFAVYFFLTQKAREDGVKQWPLKMLFSIGFAFAIIGWLVLLFMEDRDRNMCYEAARMENGQIIPEREYECEIDMSNLGVPTRETPNDAAPGLGTHGNTSE